MQWLRAPSLKSIATLVILTIVVNVAVLLLVLPVKAGAASSWNPGLLVNTEAFQTIDDADTAANVRLTFGETLQESLTYNRSESQFEFTRSLKVGGNLTATGSLTITGTGSMSDLTLPSMALGTPTYSTVKDFMNSFGSTGRKSGGVISDAGSSTVAVTGGTGFIKATDDDNAQLLFFDFPAPDNISIPSNSTRYIGVEYNSGTPQVVARESWNWDLDTEFPLGRVVNDSINGADELYIANNPWWVTDGTTNIIEAIRSFGLVRRDQAVGGLMLSVPGTRNIAVSAGTVWNGLNEYDVAAVDTSASGTVEYYWYKAGSGWQKSDVTQYSVTQWNDVTKTALQTMDNNKFGNIWVYGELDSDVADIALLYPQAQYNTAAEAEATNTPSTVPSHIVEAGMLLGRIIIKQNVDAPVSVESAFGTTYNASVTSDHGNLSGLTDDDHTQYLNLDGRTGGQRVNDSVEFTGTASGRIVSFGERLTGSGTVSIRTLTDSTTAFQVLDNDGGNPVFNIDTTNERVGIGTAAPETALEVTGTASGDLLHAEKDLSSSGTLAIEGAAAFGSTIKIGGVTYTFPASDGTASGKVLKTDSAGTLSWSTDNATDTSKIGASTAEGMFVNQGGDTMTGALQIRPSTLGQAELEVAGTASGRILSFGDRLTGSGSVSIRTLTDSVTAFQVFDSDGGNPVFNIDTTNERVGIGTAAPETALETVGTISGSTIVDSGLTSGRVTYATTKGQLTDSANLFWNATNNRLGIGTSSPASLLHITSEGGGSTKAFVNEVTGGDIYYVGNKIMKGANSFWMAIDTSAGSAFNTGIANSGVLWRNGDNPIQLVTNSVARITILGSGNVGIGTTAPETKLEVTGTMSGAALQANSINGSASAATGSIMIGQAAGAPIWKAPTSAMVWYIDGAVATGTKQGATVVMPYGFTCTDVDMRVDTAPAGAALIVDINKDGGTIFSTNPEIDDGGTTEDGNHVFSTTDLPAGSVITLDIDQVGSDTAGSDLTVILKGTRKF